MSKKTLLILSFTCLALIFLYFLSDGGSVSKKSKGRALIFSQMKWDSVSSITLQKGEASLEIESLLNGGSWTIPSRNSYPASASAVRSLFLKLMDLSSAQAIDASQEGIKKLGLSDDSREFGQGSIAFKDKSGKVLDKLYLGGLRTRKNETPEKLMSLSGQYVRLESRPDIFLVPLPVTFQTDVSAWLETGVLSIKPSLVYRVMVLDGTGLSELFRLDRSTLLRDEKEPEFSLSIAVPAGKEVQDTTVRQLVLALEDLRLEDVKSKTDDVVKDFTPSRILKYELVNGLVYLLGVKETDGVAYLSLSVSRDEALVEELVKKFEIEGLNENGSDDQISDETILSTESNSEASDNKPDLLKTPVFASVDEARTENDRLNSWIYIVPDFVAKKFIKDQSEFFREKPVEE
ncbi:MAG TPA: DUF4340 domain-containing protein [Oligoflexia bacterium]|nr:DUF4340 domain-containing protein [Oligoflexia bacterium]HMP47209.1 DUF4340 domain-containing protein [Oligoflexia bacterium]